MLINFSVENFRSFGAEQTLNLVGSKALKGHDDHCVEIPHAERNVLRTSVIYGANAAGKSNLVRAIRFAQELIEHGAGPMKRIALNQFRFTSEERRSSSFEFRFMAGGRVFVYGFELTADAVIEEWLSITSEKGKEVDVFTRTGQDISIKDLKGFGDFSKVSLQALKALEQLGTRPNQLLLNKIVDLDSDKRGELLDLVVWWFVDCLTVIAPEASFGAMIELLDDDPDFRHFAGEFLSSVGTGIGGLDVEQAEIDADKLPKPIVETLQSQDVEVTPIAVGPGMSLYLDPDDPTKIIRRNLAARHRVKDDDYALSFSEESDGTQRFLHLLPALYHLKRGCKVFVIDEMDRSLHPLLSHALLKFFVEVCPRACQQMIVTTHETHLLDQELLRRDEIWFAEKDDQQQTKLYSLADMSGVRKDLRIERGYLHGRFGGIPFIGGTDRLKDLIECPTGIEDAQETPR